MFLQLMLEGTSSKLKNINEEQDREYFYFIISNKFPSSLKVKFKKILTIRHQDTRIALVTTITQTIYNGRIRSSYYTNSKTSITSC